MSGDPESWRWPRALLLAAVATFAGVAGHVQADGLLPGPTGLLLTFALCVLGAGVFLGGPASTLRVVALTVGGQTGVHVVLTLTAGHAGDVPAAPVVAGPVPDPAAYSSFRDYALAAQPHVEGGSGPVVPAALRHLVTDLTGAHAPMMAVHLAAAVVVGLWLAVGERALWTLVALAARVVLPRVPAAVTPWLPPAQVPERRPVALVPSCLIPARSVVRRGPPVLLAG